VFRVIAWAAILPAIISTVSASTPLVLDGIYNFVSSAYENGKPVCTETWAFKDGAMTIESGQEVARHAFRTEMDADGANWLVRTFVESNGKPDCTGNVANPGAGPHEENRIYLLERNDGSIAVCPPPGRTADGTSIVGDCWGDMTPVY
jgi:hypothetical protein